VEISSQTDRSTSDPGNPVKFLLRTNASFISDYHAAFEATCGDGFAANIK